MKKICIIVPILNEEEVLEVLRERILDLFSNMPSYKMEVLFVNDGSSDKSLEMMEQFHGEDERFSYLNLSRNFGKETAIIAGLDYCDADAAIILDADLQDPPELIPELVFWWEMGYDDVYARRRMREGETLLKLITSKLYYRVLQCVSDVTIQPDTGDFRLLDRRCMDVICSMREHSRCSKSIFSWVGYRKKEIMYDRCKREYGVTKWNYKKLMNLAVNGITSVTISPLRWPIWLGCFCGLAEAVTLLSMLWNLIRGKGIGAALGITSLILLLAGAQFFLLGIMGEYLGQIFLEAKKRPLYLVDSFNGITGYEEESTAEEREQGADVIPFQNIADSGADMENGENKSEDGEEKRTAAKRQDGYKGEQKKTRKEKEWML